MFLSLYVLTLLYLCNSRIIYALSLYSPHCNVLKCLFIFSYRIWHYPAYYYISYTSYISIYYKHFKATSCCEFYGKIIWVNLDSNNTAEQYPSQDWWHMYYNTILKRSKPINELNNNSSHTFSDTTTPFTTFTLSASMIIPAPAFS